MSVVQISRYLPPRQKSQYELYPLPFFSASKHCTIVLDMIENECPDHIAVGFFQTVADVCLGLLQIPAAYVRLVVAK